MARSSQQRQLLASRIARILWEDGIQDFRLAKEKALRQSGATTSELPDNREIVMALRSHAELFGGHDWQRHRKACWVLATSIAQVLVSYEIRLAGALVEGWFTPHAEVELQVFAETPEPVALQLERQGFTVEWREKRLRLRANEYQEFPVLHCQQGEGATRVGVRILVLPSALLRQAPLSPVDGKPMRRLQMKEAETQFALGLL